MITYKNIAKEIAKQKGIDKMSAQAVGGAVGIIQFLSLFYAIE